MSGFYNYWPKVNHPNVIFPQMKSEGFKPPFYFGGSQVPINIGMVGRGNSDIRIPTKTDTYKQDDTTINFRKKPKR